MNILFFLRSIGVGYGGIEVVSITLADYMHKMGHNVYICALYKGDSKIIDRIDTGIPLFIGKGNKYSKENVTFLRSILQKYNIEYAINQMALPYVPIKILKAASKGSTVKIISVYHNAPNANGRIQGIDNKLAVVKGKIDKMLLLVKRAVFKWITSRAMIYNYQKCDKYLVLSESYLQVFKDFTGLKDAPKLGVMTNPVTIDRGDYEYDETAKEKEILFVGRLDFVQKRVYRVIDTWNLLEDNYPDWHLTIVGDGVDRNNLEQHVKAMNLKRVYFEGFKKPNEYYKRASILILTSDFEGFPLVLAEAMSFGVVPVVYDSFAAVRDIIKDGKNGSIVSPVDGVFSAEAMAKPLQSLMDNSTLLTSMAHAAIDESKNYNIDTIYQKWNALLSSLK